MAKKHGKRYNDLLRKFDPHGDYSVEDAVRLVKSMATANFDETVELHFRLGIDPRQAEQQVRTTLMLPNGLGKEVRVLVFAEGEDARAAEEAGADIIADDEVIQQIQDGWTEFDNAIAVANMMPKVGRLGRVLGPRGLMPTPKAGTVVNNADDLQRVVKELKSGRLEFRNDRTGNVHIPVGKASFDYEKLLENVQAAIDTVEAQRPDDIKGIYIRRAVICAAMSPAIRLNL